MLVDELLLVNDFRGNLALRSNRDALTLQLVTHERVYRVCNGMGLNEDESLVLRRPATGTLLVEVIP